MLGSSPGEETRSFPGEETYLRSTYEEMWLPDDSDPRYKILSLRSPFILI